MTTINNQSQQKQMGRTTIDLPNPIQDTSDYRRQSAVKQTVSYTSADTIVIQDKDLEAKIKLVWRPTILDVLINYPCQRALHPFEWELANRSKIWRDYFARSYYA